MKIYLKIFCFIFITILALNMFVFAASQEDLFNKGILQLQNNQFSSAVKTFTQFLELFPNDAKVYKNRGVAYMKQNMVDLAITDFEKAQVILPELPGLSINLGAAWYYKKKYLISIQYYDQEIQQNPDTCIAIFNRGLCWEKLGKYDKALNDMDKTLAIKPDFYWALCYKGNLLVKTNNKSMAKAVYREAVKLEPENSYARKQLNILMEQSKKDTLDKYYLQAGAFKKRQNAEKLYNQLQLNQFDTIIALKNVKGQTWYVIKVGSFKNALAAKDIKNALQKKMGIKPLIMPLSNLQY